MQPARLLLILIILIPFMMMIPGAAAQPTAQYVSLFAHSLGGSAILNAIPQWTGQKAADVSKGLNFKLSPVLGSELRIYGTIAFTLYLRASGPFFGTVEIQVAEQPKGTAEAAVPGARVDSPLILTTTTVPVTLGVGIIDYDFHEGSAIVLRIAVNQTSGSGTPLLVWDDSTTPTSLRLPAISPASAHFSFQGQPIFTEDVGRIFHSDPSSNRIVRISADVMDAIGVYRFNSISIRLTAPNGTSANFQLAPNNNTDYSSFYSTAQKLNQGPWQVDLLLRDVTGYTYTFTNHLWVSPFYPISFDVVGSDGNPIRDATLTATLGTEAAWSAVTNSTGWGTLSLPMSQVVGPMDLTITWFGTQTVLPLEVVGPQKLLLQLRVYDVTVRIAMNGLPVPAAHVTLIQYGVVQNAYTGLTGVVNFKTIPAGNYTLRVDYFFTTFLFPLNVKANSMTTVTVPFPHRTISLASALTIMAVASVVLVRRRRGKLYPRGFNYFLELTHGGLPEACYTVIAGNSGSGKSVLLNSLVAEHLTAGKSIYITNTEYPDRIRESIAKLGISDIAHAKDERLIFIDAYSAVGGGSSKEPFSVTSHTDLTHLGLSVTKCLQVGGAGADVYFDSLNPLISVLRIDYLINFLQSVAAKVKANNGKLCVTVGEGIEKNDLTKLEEASDCVIETQLQEAGDGQRRRLRIKKLRDKPYIDRWTRFRVEEGKGIIFLTGSKPPTSPRA